MGYFWKQPEEPGKTLTVNFSPDPDAGLYCTKATVHMGDQLSVSNIETNAENMDPKEALDLKQKLDACGVVLTSDQWAELRPEDVEISQDDNGWKLKGQFYEDPKENFVCKSVEAHFDSEGKLAVQAQSTLPNLPDYAKCRGVQQLEDLGLELTPYQWEHLQPDHVTLNEDKRASGALPIDPEAAFQFYNFTCPGDGPPSLKASYIDRVNDEGITSEAWIRVTSQGSAFNQFESKDGGETVDKTRLTIPGCTERFFGDISEAKEKGDLVENWLQGNPQMTPESREQFGKNTALQDALISDFVHRSESPEIKEIGQTYFQQASEARETHREQLKNGVPKDEAASTLTANLQAAQGEAKVGIKAFQKEQAVANGLVVGERPAMEEAESHSMSRV